MARIRKDPEELPDDVVDFQEVFSDINSPEYWISTSEDDLKPSLIVLDGHSTVIVYEKETEELHWEALHDMGNYEYIPDNVGDGMITFPHTFYYEFKIKLSRQELDVNANFDGSGIRAIVMPFKDVTVDNFIESLRDRLSDIFSSVLKPNDDRLTIEEGEVLGIPEKVMSQLSLKLSLIGVNVERVKVDKITELEIEEGEMVEKVFEVPPKAEEKEAMEEAAKAKPRQPTPKKEAPSPPPSSAGGKKVSSGPPSPGAPKAPPAAPPSPPKAGGGGGPPSPGGPPGPSSKGKSVSSGPPGPTAKGNKVEGGPPGPSPKSTSAPPPAAKRSRSAASVEKSDLAPAADEFDLEEMAEEEEADVSGGLLPREMAPDTGSHMTLKHTHATYFERMIPNRAYLTKITISTEHIQARKSVTNQLTGEKKSEKTGSMVADTKELVKVRPEFPGCMVVPEYRMVDIDKDKAEAKFYVTPLAVGSLDAKVVFEQNDEVIHSIDLETKVIKPRLSKWSAIIGTLTGVVPALMAFFLNETPATFITTRMNTWGLDSIADLGYLVPTILTLFLFGISGGAYMLQKPVYADKSVSFPR